MPKHTVVIERCKSDTANEQVSARVGEMLGKLPGLDERLSSARRIFVKLNIGLGQAPEYLGRPFDCVDSSVFSGLATFVRDRTDAHVLIGDGWGDAALADRARDRGHMAAIERCGYELVHLGTPPYARFDVPEPAMFRWYELSSALQDVDLTISVSKMKAHHLCGITLSIKNLFGLPPTSVYCSPLLALHSNVRQPGILADLTSMFPPEICLIDGIVGCSYAEWHGQGADPVAPGVLIAGDNPVATDAVGARFMRVDPAAPLGTAPFWLTDNHIRFASERGLGSIADADIDIIGDIPAVRKQFSVATDFHPESPAHGERWRADVCRQAEVYFRDRDRYAGEYAGEVVLFGKGEALYHATAPQLRMSDMFGALTDAGIGPYECFVKLVREEEDELKGPYGL